MTADIVTGKTALADALFLVAAVLAFVAALLSASRRPEAVWASVAGWLAVTVLAVAWLVL